MKEIKHKWWQEAIGYQIYIRSFQDSNNDGIGDLKGIISRLDYLKYLGINLIWICPFCSSPMDDNGYDVSDFYDVSSDYGSLNDIKTLIIKAHDKGIKVMMDLILNHTSDEHYWFKEARKAKDNPYHDYYIWGNPRIINGEKKEPTNWASFFGGSAWEYNETTDEYYMKIFSKKMPDLNWKNPMVQKEMIKVATFWCDLGIDGFRIDAASHLGKDTLVDVVVDKPEDWYHHNCIKFSNLPIVHEYMHILNKEVFSKYDIITVGEVGGYASVDDALKFTMPSREELEMVFNFDHNWCNNGWDRAESEKQRINVAHLKEMFNKWQTGLQGKTWNAIYWLNHDQPRVATHYGDKDYYLESTKMLAIALYFMWGTPFIYNGEEIGMTSPKFTSLNDFRDVSIKNAYLYDVVEHGETFEHFIKRVSYSTRDNARTLMQWDDSINGGFSQGKPWNIICSNYQKINVKNEINDPTSVLSFYKKVIDLRLNSKYKDVITYGKYQQLYYEHPSLYCYERILKKQKLLVICNLTDNIVELPLIKEEYQNIILSNYPNNLRKVQELPLNLKPFEAYVLVCD